MQNATTNNRIAELELLLIRAQAETHARREALRAARNNVSYLLGALDEARRAAAEYEKKEART